MPRALQALLLVLVLAAAPSARADFVDPWSPGPDASGDDSFAGFVDAPATGALLSSSAPIEVRGWVVDQTADGWAGIDQVQVATGILGQGGQVLATAIVAQDRQDVAQALGNPFFSASGYSAVLPAGSVPPGQSTLNVYVHSPGKGWWYRSLAVQVQAQAPGQAAAPVPRATPPDLVLVVQGLAENTTLAPTVTTVTLSGFALDRRAPVNVNVFPSGVNHVQVYLDGGRRDGTFLGEAQMGKQNREATGFGERFLTAGWEMQIHPNEFEEGPHALFVYATSTDGITDTLTVLTFRRGG